MCYCLFQGIKGQCGTSFSCANTTLTAGAELLGYKSGYKSIVDYNTRLYVKGSFGAALSPSIDTTSSYIVSCYAVGSCNDAIIDLATNFECNAAASCVNFKVNATSGNCIGDSTCVNAEFKGLINYVGPLGAYSAVNSIINMSNIESTSILIRYSGFNSGYNSTIICGVGDTCDIECWANGCVNVNFICNNSESNCSVDCSNTESRYCPKYNSNTSTWDVSRYKDFEQFYGMIKGIYNINDSYTYTTMAEIGIINDNNCNDYSGAVLYDIDQSTSGDIIISNYTLNNGSNICCRGHGGCDSSNVLIMDTMSDVICSGNQACQSITTNGIRMLKNNSNIYCNGRFGCKSSVIKFEYVDGYNSLICGGHQGCYSSTIYGNGGINGVTNVFCSSYQSCDFSTMYNVTNVYFLATPRTTGTNTNIVIYNTPGNELNVYLYGYNPAESSLIVCEGDGAICNIECKFVNSCYQVTVQCDADTQCNICCDDTYGIDCPSMTGSGTITYTS